MRRESVLDHCSSVALAVMVATACTSPQRFSGSSSSEDSSLVTTSGGSPSTSQTNHIESQSETDGSSALPTEAPGSSPSSGGETSLPVSPGAEVSTTADEATGAAPTAGISSTGASSGDTESQASSDEPGASTPPYPASSEPSVPDECPNHAEQYEAGSCGCGHAPEPACDALRSALRHRYSFLSQVPTTTVEDSVGDADATVYGGRPADDGALIVEDEDSYVALPEGILSKLEQATLDLWVLWWGGAENQRIFNFGKRPLGGDAPDNYLSLSPRSSDGVLAAQYRTARVSRGERLDAEFVLETGAMQHLTLVIEEQQVHLYVNGNLAARQATTNRLERLDDEDNWLGRALYRDYPSFNGALYEFRVFGRALPENEVKTLEELGLDLPNP